MIQTRSQVGSNPEISSWFEVQGMNQKEFQEAQMQDPVLSEVHRWVKKGTRPNFDDISHEGRELKFYWGQFSTLKLVNGVLV